MKASERLRELDEVIRNGVPDDAEPALWSLKPALPLIADVVEAAESVYADNEDGEIGIALWPALTALTAALQPPTESSPPPPEGATAPCSNCKGSGEVMNWVIGAWNRCSRCSGSGVTAALEGDTPR